MGAQHRHADQDADIRRIEGERLLVAANGLLLLLRREEDAAGEHRREIGENRGARLVIHRETRRLTERGESRLVLLLVEGGGGALEPGTPERPQCIGVARLRDERLRRLDRFIVLARREQLVDPHQCGGIGRYLRHRAMQSFPLPPILPRPPSPEQARTERGWG